MDNVRLFLWFALLAMFWLSYNAWVSDHAPPPAPEPTAVSPALPEPGDSGALPSLVETEPSPQLPDETVTEPAAEESATVRVRTDVFDLLIDTRGGDLVRADLLEYPVEKSAPDRIVRLLDNAPGSRWVFQTGLRNVGEGPEANHLAMFSSERSSYELGPGDDELRVRLDWAEPGDLIVHKTYTFRRGRYDIELDITVENGGDEPWRGAPYSQMLRLHQPVQRTFRSVDTYSFIGPVLYDGDRYEKLQFDDLANEAVAQTVENGWYAGIQHHFLAAAVPPPSEPTAYRAATRGPDYVLSAVGAVTDLAPGASWSYPLRLFVGPKLQNQLSETADGLELTVDYGVLTVLAQPLFWALNKLHGWVGNWGWAIILVTMLIKLLFYKLTQMSGRSMAKMRKLAPRMKALQERYKDDRQALSQAMMELYKKEKANPAAGCLPLLIQMPFFLAFYWVLIESVEMRQAPFMLWIEDLSARDPYFILPLLMGAAMFFQTRLNPAPPDPVQARVMQFMPLIFTVFFAFFPSGLVLYYITNTLLSMLQQWRINTVIEREA